MNFIIMFIVKVFFREYRVQQQHQKPTSEPAAAPQSTSSVARPDEMNGQVDGWSSSTKPAVAASTEHIPTLLDNKLSLQKKCANICCGADRYAIR